MASRQTSVSTGLQYAANGSYSNNQIDITLTNQSGNPKLSQMNSGGRGVSNTASSQLFHILPANSSPGVSGLTESGTTVTVTLGTPHGLAIASSGQTITVSTGVGGYNTTTTITNVTGPYSFTYTAGSSGLTSPSGDGTVSLVGGSGAALLAWQPALNGSTFGGSTCGTLEIWGDNALWDTTNSRYVTPQLAGQDPASMQ